MGPAPERPLTPREFVDECYAFKREHAPQSRLAGIRSRKRARNFGRDREQLPCGPRRGGLKEIAFLCRSGRRAL